MNRLRTTLVGLILILLAAGTAQAAGTISPAELRRMQETKTSFYLLDVRSNQTFLRKHIQGAINIPAFVIDKKGFPKGETFVLYDGGIGSTEARTAAEKMASAGYGKVRILEGGLARWEATGLPLNAPTGILTIKLVEALTVSELQQAQLDRMPATIVDLRAPQLFLAGSVPGAKNSPLSRIHTDANEWSKDELVVLIDGGDNEAERQAETLRRAGFKLIRFLHGGYPEWKRQNAL